MKKIIILFLMFFVFGAGDVMAQRRSTNTNFKFTDDMKLRTKTFCPVVKKDALKSKQNLQPFCSVNDIEVGENDLGPWKQVVAAFEKLFKQFRRFIYVGAVFFMLWLFVKAAYEGEMKWTHLGILIVGVVILAFAEVMIDIATNRVTIDDVIVDGVYVDCRDNTPSEAFYKCSTDSTGASLLDSRYFLQLSGEIPSDSPKLKGLY